MQLIRQALAVRLLLLGVLLANAAWLWPELSMSRVDLNDNSFHFALAERMVQAVEHGENPLDAWDANYSFGYPVLRTYQPLAHAIVVLAYFLGGKTVPLMTVFVVIRFLSLALLPLSFFAAARLLALPASTSLIAAILAPLVSTNGLFGLEYGSYVWAGTGLFSQSVATHFLLLTIGLSWRAIHRGNRITGAGAMLGITFLTHLIYGYVGAVTVCLMALSPGRETLRAIRIRRAAFIVAVAMLIAGFQLLPILLDSATINHSRWEPQWKWDSFGAGQVLKWLVGGELLDHGRLPVLSALALLGLGIILWDWYRTRRIDAGRAFVLLGAATWILIFFGRPFWGPFTTVLGVPGDMHLHRVIGGVHIFLVLLAAVGLASVWRAVACRSNAIVGSAVVALLVFPAVQERGRYLRQNRVWGQTNLAAFNEERKAVEAAVSQASARGGRAYAGPATGWGSRFQVGMTPFYTFLSVGRVPALSFLYHSMALTSDIAGLFNEWSPAHYRLFNVRTVIAPAQGGPPLPPFLMPLQQAGPFRIFGTPASGYFDLVDAPFAVYTTRENFYDVNSRWLQGEWARNKQHLWLDFGEAPNELKRISVEDALPNPPDAPSPGEIRSEVQNGEVYQADVEAIRPSFVLFKMTWHRNWKALVDGKKARTMMLSPGFVGVPILPGRHRLTFRYEPEAWKSIMGLSGLALVLLLAVGEWRGYSLPALAAIRIPAWALTGTGLFLLALPVCVCLLTARIPAGHDALAYLPRLVEFHENLAHGVLLPRWAPDLGRGGGQPVFLFNPPMVLYLAEFWHLIGFGFTTALNLACVVVVLTCAAGMFLLGRLYFNAAGGWLAAAAYLYAPYFAVDLYVRSAMAEFTAFAFVPFALFGFGALAKYGGRKYLLIGGAACAGILFSHVLAALYFMPLVLAFVVFNAWRARSWPLLRSQIFGFLLGVALAACIWLPALVHRSDVQLERATQGYFRYSNHFVYLHQLLFSPWGYGYSVPGYPDGMSFSLGWSHLLLAAGVCLWAWRKLSRIDCHWLCFFGIAALVVCFFAVLDSVWLWEHFPPGQWLQFPWRLLGAAAICIAALIAPLGKILDGFGRWRAPAFAGAMALLIIPNLPHLQPNQYRDIDVALWTPQQIAWRGIETTTSGEYTPAAVKSWPAYDARAARVVHGDAQMLQSWRTPVAWSGRILASAQSTVELSIASFPGWQVRVNGQTVKTKVAPQTGLIQFEVPAGGNRVEAAWTGTTSCWIGDSVSILAILAFVAAAYRRPKPSEQPATIATTHVLFKWATQTLPMLIGITLLAALLRFVALEDIPPGIYSDEAINGVEGYGAVVTRDFSLFYPANNGREGLWINMIGVAESLLGVPNPVSLRFLAALAGVLTVLGLFFLTRELLASNRVALLATFFIAFSFWHITLSRVAFSAILVPLLLIWSLYLLLKAWKNSRQAPAKAYLAQAVLSGLLFGLGFHTYIAYRFAPLLACTVIGVELLRWRKMQIRLKPFCIVVCCWLSVAFVVALPIAWYFYVHPQEFFSRARGISIFGTQSPWETLSDVFVKTMGMFNFQGDCNWRHNMGYPTCSPQLLPPVGLLFMVGVWIAFKDGILYRGMQYKAQKGQHRDAYIVILAWLVILLVPEVLTWEGVPHALRSIGVIPPAMILAAIGADFLYERFVQPHHPSACATGGAANANSPRRYGRWRLCLFAVVLLSIGVAETYRYFIVWAANPATPLYFSRPYVKIGEYLNWEPY